MARRSTSLLQVVAVVATCFWGLGYSHLRALRRRSDSQFHVVRGGVWRAALAASFPWYCTVADKLRILGLAPGPHF